MKRIMYVAMREFASTAMTKGFVIGAFVVPGVIVAVSDSSRDQCDGDSWARCAL